MKCMYLPGLFDAVYMKKKKTYIPLIEVAK
jgi:hypothetical protein